MDSRLIQAYKTLGLQFGETDIDIILQAYRVKIREWHPDLNKSANASEQAKAINDALRVIKSYLASHQEKTNDSNACEDKRHAFNFAKRALLFIEDREWKKALEYCEKALDLDAECGRAYLCKYLANHHYSSSKEVKENPSSFIDNPLINKAFRFGDKELISILNEILERNETAKRMRILDQQYFNATELMNKAKTSSDYLTAATAFQNLAGHRGSDQLYQFCMSKAKELKFEESQLDYVYYCRNCGHISFGPQFPDTNDILCPYCESETEVTDIRIDKWNYMSPFAKTTQIKVWKNLNN